MIREVSVAEALELSAAGYRIIDVREPVEWNEGHIPSATLLPLADVSARIGEVAPDRSAPILVHCAVGARSLRAAAYLGGIGYTNVASLHGSLVEWRRQGGAWEAPEVELSTVQKRRYARQLAIPEIGPSGQRKLIGSKVVLIGAGGLGSPVSLYLAAAGIGTIGLVDDDVVDESNLQRQVVHATERIGMAKTQSAGMAITALNPQTRVIEHRERLTGENVARLIADYDVVVDGADSFDTRYALNEAAVALRKPVVHGSVYRWDGQVTTFVPFVGPCYRCLYPTQPPADLAAACEVAGVVGVLPGIVGLIQANEALKLLLGIGETLVGRLLLVDGLRTSFSEVTIHRDPACPACGEGTLQ